jgi:hypothetical protein
MKLGVVSSNGRQWDATHMSGDAMIWGRWMVAPEPGESTSDRQEGQKGAPSVQIDHVQVT